MLHSAARLGEVSWTREGMMTVLRSSLERNAVAVRMAVLLLVAHALLPFQLAWCFEDDQCLSECDHPCCTGNNAAASKVGRGGERYASLVQGNEHSHCVGCSDELDHKLFTSQLARVSHRQPRGIVAGCLFSLIPPELTNTPITGKLAWQAVQHRTPMLAILHTQATRLLI